MLCYQGIQQNLSFQTLKVPRLLLSVLKVSAISHCWCVQRVEKLEIFSLPSPSRCGLPHRTCASEAPRAAPCQ